jgi:hypothetical protein
MTQKLVLALTTRPGISRDGSPFEVATYTDGEWVRFQRGKPRKIGGYRRITGDMTGPINKVLVWSRQDLNAVFSFSTSKAEMLLIDNNGVGNGISNRTPIGFTSDSDNIWSVDTQYDDAVDSQGAVILAHCSQSMTNIDDGTASKPYLMVATPSDPASIAATALTINIEYVITTVGTTDFTLLGAASNTVGLAFTANGTSTGLGSGTVVLRSSVFYRIDDAPAVSGGIFSLAPYTVCYGSDGYVAWSDINQPQVWDTSTSPGDAGSDRITGAKIVKGLPVRAGSGVAAILWSLDSVLRMDYVGGQAIFRFSTVSTQSSILAQNSVIEYDGMFYWIGTDRFMYFDSTVRELPNDFNQNWFFDNLNYAERQKIWATKIPRFGEIWWFYPSGESTVCDRAVVFNVREKIWFDVAIGRGAGFYSQVFRYPIWAGSSAETGGSTYGMFAHEFQMNAVVGDTSLAIRSTVTTQDISLANGIGEAGPKSDSAWTSLSKIEPDVTGSGNMAVTVVKTEYPASDSTETRYEFDQTTEKIDMREQARHLRLRFESNDDEGDFILGRTLIHLSPGDKRS